MTSELTHFDEQSRAAMVDVSDKPLTLRRAQASARVKLQPATVAAIRNLELPKGDALEIARIAGIMAAKQTSNLIPLCHQIALSKVDVRIELLSDGVKLLAEAVTTARTGVEMEALTAVTVAALTIYDMCKAVDKQIEVTNVRLETKTGGRGGDFQRAAGKD